VAAFDRNRWPPSVGIDGRFASDSARDVPSAIQGFAEGHAGHHRELPLRLV